MAENLTPELVAQITREYSIMKRATRAFKDLDTPEEEIALHIQALRAFGGERLSVSYEPFEHWCAAFEAARAATSRDEIKALARRYVCTAHPFAASPYKTAQGAMKATIHTLWKRLYALETSRGHLSPAPAVRDATMPRHDRAIEYFRVMMAEIAVESGETTEQMQARVCGD